MRDPTTTTSSVESDDDKLTPFQLQRNELTSQLWRLLQTWQRRCPSTPHLAHNSVANLLTSGPRNPDSQTEGESLTHLFAVFSN